MPQFSAQSLSRLLQNVDRDVLEEAIEDADMWDLFGSYERGVILELGEKFNFYANFITFADDIVDRTIEKIEHHIRLRWDTFPPPLQLLFTIVFKVIAYIEQLFPRIAEIKGIVETVVTQVEIEGEGIADAIDQLEHAHGQVSHVLMTTVTQQDLITSLTLAVNDIYFAAKTIRSITGEGDWPDD